MKTPAFDCPIIKTEQIAHNIIDMHLNAPSIAKTAEPGQFIHIQCGGTVFLRRPISICDCFADVVRIIFEVKGEGTKELATKKVGDTVNVIAPLGRGFEPIDRPCAIVGGGVGVFPLLFLAKKLNAPLVFLGFRTKELIVLEDEFKQVAADVIISTDDGSYGHKGLVTDLLPKHSDCIAIYYACGPTPMLKAVRDMAMNEGKPCQISVEQRMACGVGACLVCACRVGGEYQRVCSDGPVFQGREVDFNDEHRNWILRP